jgi:spore photoproduct lyase
MVMKKVNQVTRKTFTIRDSGRSSDYITPSFGYGCLFNCTYCYMKRHLSEGLTVAQNTGEILTAVNNHSYFYADAQKPNQTHPEYMTYDISCNEDFALHAKYHSWRQVFEFFKEHPIAMGTLATKTVPHQFLDYNPEGKIRIRFSLMPQSIADKLEPNTAKIIDRIQAINTFIDAGYDIHINFSPVVVYEGWEQEYTDLFRLVNENVSEANKATVFSEVIFLTHNEGKHHYNVENNLPGEELLWTPENQEEKTSQYGGKNLRYNYKVKKQYIDKFKEIHSSIIPWNTIRYIF